MQSERKKISGGEYMCMRTQLAKIFYQSGEMIGESLISICQLMRCFLLSVRTKSCQRKEIN